MGDIADMLIDGTLDSDGYYNPSKKIACPSCGKKVKRAGLDAHSKAMHDKDVGELFDGKIMAMDYSQLEQRVVAHLSGGDSRTDMEKCTTYKRSGESAKDKFIKQITTTTTKG